MNVPNKTTRMPSTQLKMKGTGPDSAHAQRWARSIWKDIPNNTDQFLNISEIPPEHGLQQRAFSSLLSPLPRADSKCTTLDSAKLRTSALSLKNKQKKRIMLKERGFLVVVGFHFLFYRLQFSMMPQKLLQWSYKKELWEHRDNSFDPPVALQSCCWNSILGLLSSVH